MKNQNERGDSEHVHKVVELVSELRASLESVAF